MRIRRRKQDIRQKVMSRIKPVHRGYTLHLGNLPSACWEWQGPDSGNGRGGGYPRMALDGQTVAVHKVMYTDEYGFIPGKKQIDHKCENRICVNPQHLQMVTHKKNQKLKKTRKPQ